MEFPALGSTNEHSRKIAETKEAEEGTVVWTKHQTRGKGQGTSSWESEDGKNLTFSIILYPLFLEPSDQFLLSMTASVGITCFLEKYLDNLSIKWPNDIYAGSKKIAGILIENSVMENRLIYSIIGAGLNVNQTAFGRNIPNAVSMKQLTNRDYCLEDSLEKISNEILKWYDLLKHGGMQEIKKHYSRKLFRLNENYPFREGNKIFGGRIKGVDDYGRLILETEDGTCRYFVEKEVEFLT